MIYTALTRAISECTEIVFTSGDVAKVSVFYDVPTGNAYFGTVASVPSSSSVVLAVGSDLPVSNLTIENITLLTPDADISPASNALVSLAEVKAYLGETGTTRDNMLQGWINDVSDNIEGDTNRIFKSKIVSDEIYDGTGTNRLYLVNAPVLGPKTSGDWSPDILTRVDPSQAWTAIEDTKAFIYTRPTEPYYIELYRQLFPRGVQNVKVSYTCGYSVIPPEIKRIAKEMVAMLWNNSKNGRDSLGKSHVSVNMAGATDSQTFEDMQPKWDSVISQFRRAL